MYHVMGYKLSQVARVRFCPLFLLFSPDRHECSPHAVLALGGRCRQGLWTYGRSERNIGKLDPSLISAPGLLVSAPFHFEIYIFFFLLFDSCSACTTFGSSSFVRYHAVCPPSTRTSAPVMKLLASLRRWTILPRYSCASLTRHIMLSRGHCAPISASASGPAVILVRMYPGEIELTRISGMSARLPHSAARERVI